MDTNTPSSRNTERTGEVVPDPHRAEPAPAPQEGLRPEADPALVRPEQDEPGGPIGGLLSAVSTETATEATPGTDPAAEALLEQMGVEEEGIESGQLLGFVVATLLAVAALAVVLIYFIYSPYRGSTQAQADNVDVYPELQQSRVDARAKLDQATRTGDAYTIPIGRAMGLVAAEYGTSTGAPSPDAAARTLAVPSTRQAFNTLMVNRNEGYAVQRVQPSSALATPAPANAAPVGADPGTFTPNIPTPAEVGVDDVLDNPEAPEPRPDID